MPITPEFRKLYKKLNPEQKKAVDAIEGPVMVIAGPGTGKTQILALRIANILKRTDTSPDSILALTFTESGVFSMRKRLVSIIGSPAYKINIFTFHGFCNEIIKTYPEEFPRIIGARNASEIEQVSILEEILSSTKLEYLKPYGDVFYYLRPVLSIIRNLKREDINPKEFEKIIADQQKSFENIPDLNHEKGAYKGKIKGEYADLEKKIEKNKELLLLYKKYEDALKKHKFYDYEDMIIEVVKTLKSNKDLLLRLQERYQYILADEHQDANRAQNEILELLSNFHPDPNLFIVGDEKQAIFRFQGASLENFLYFKKLYPHAEVISLTQNYRSTQNILDIAHSLIVNNKTDDESLRKKLVAQDFLKNKENINKYNKDRNNKNLEIPKILISEFSSPEYELLWITEDIKKKINSGVNPDEIAVIYRENRDSQAFMKYLEKAGIKFTLQSDQNIFEDADISKLLLLLKTVNRLGDPELLVQLLYLDFLHIEPLDVYKLIHCAHKNKLSLFDALRKEECLEDAGVEQKEELLKLSKQLSSWATVSKNKNLLETVEIILNESGFLTHIINLSDSVEKLAKLETVYVEMKKLSEQDPNAKLSQFISYTEVLKKYNILIKTGVIGEHTGSVRLMTAHRSKGLEFEYVYIVGTYDGHWGNKREIRHFHIPIKGLMSQGIDPLEDERRLFYVALTRAKKFISISYSKTEANGENLLPSQFISELKPELIKYLDTKKQEQELQNHPIKLYAQKNPAHTQVQVKDKEFLNSIFEEQGLSVTALNKFISCPWDYFFNNLLRIPSTETKHQMYGTAIHHALRDFFNAYAREEDWTEKQLIQSFTNYLQQMPLQNLDFEESLKKGKEALSGYYKNYKNKWSRALITEFAINNIELDVELEKDENKKSKFIKINLRGQLDKLELLENNKVNVVDYKTARPKSRNAIMGLTKTESGDYYRQLVFYKLLLDGLKTQAREFKNAKYANFDMASAEIDFVEPDDRGKYHKEKFVITVEEVEKLKQTIRDTAKSILTLDFWDKRCDTKDCEWCALRNLIK